MIATMMLAPIGLQAADTKTTNHNLDHDVNNSVDAPTAHTTVSSNTATNHKTTSHNTNTQQEADHKQDHSHAVDLFVLRHGDNAR